MTLGSQSFDYRFAPIEIDSNGTRFHPPNELETPDSLFTTGYPFAATIPWLRWLRRTNNRECLIFADGACLGNGTDQARAGCAFVFHPTTTNSPAGYTSFRLDLNGPQGTREPQTSNRAELRATIGILQFRAWVGEGIQRLVIATDSSYVVDCATHRIHTWQTNGWRTSGREPVKNRDLWELYLTELRRVSDLGLQVLFWKIPREWNTTADALAKQAATMADEEEFSKIVGLGC
ncbi:hypothetical protein AYO20_07590 [Fonsecaea nubica]|uniref:ribonuclease H n=1 Tax=Fonsecaea nubica TaxID=856822 RepID=A0A178CTE1_9EURO|nr:hypothetical protein AYO20_07590 [Fonsecaea nubica]OAL33108.1 hypothetical protein AYO20_07590 [Fonsecaea nubica]